MANAEIIFDLRTLSALSRAGRSDHDYVHCWALGALISAFDLSEKVIEFEIAKIHCEWAGLDLF